MGLIFLNLFKKRDKKRLSNQHLRLGGTKKGRKIAEKDPRLGLKIDNYLFIASLG
jgi:hypothetical protein